VDSTRRLPHIFVMAEGPGWIAIVDDDPSVLKALKRSLRVRGVQSKTYGSAQEFLATLPEGLPDCLILDLEMPGMTGLEPLRDLKRKDIQVPAIVITAHGDATVREHCESVGAVAYFSKPFRNSLLFAAIEAAVGSRRKSP
jgi:FixJ family two-component response regulator